MPGQVAGLANSLRHWARKINGVVTDDGATIELYPKIDENQSDGYTDLYAINFSDLIAVTDADVMGLLTTAVERIIFRGCTSLTDASMAGVAEQCLKLKLNVGGCWEITDAGIERVALNCPKLEVFFVDNCLVTDASIATIARNCKRLRVLIVGECGKLTTQ